MKIVLFVPGFMEDIDSRDYTITIKAIEECGYKVKFVDIKWLRTIPSDWEEQLNAVRHKYSPNETILAGFSFGAVTAFLSASTMNPSELWLFSLSLYFKEDFSSLKKSWVKGIGKKRGESFKKISFKNKLASIKCKTLFFYGLDELKLWPNINFREKLIKSRNNMENIYIASAPHDVTTNEYVEAIKSKLKT